MTTKTTPLVWFTNEDGELAAEHDGIEVKIVGYAFGDRLEFTRGSLDLSIDAIASVDATKRLAALMITGLVQSLERRVNAAARKSK